MIVSRRGLIALASSCYMIRSAVAFVGRTSARGIHKSVSRAVSPRVTAPSATSQYLPHGSRVRPSFTRSTVRTMASASGAGVDKTQVRASHILVKTEDEADVLINRLNDGEDFGDLAFAESQCPSKGQGGSLGWFGRGQMVPEFETAAFENDVGTLVKTKTDFGWHVVRVDEKATLPSDMHPSELGDVLGDEGKKSGYNFIDCREPDELKRADIRGAGFVNLPLSQFQQWGPKALDGSLMDKNKPTVVMCHHGGRSMQVASFLATQAGFPDVYNLSGGIHMYAELVDPSIGRY